MDEVQARIAAALRVTKPDPYTEPVSFKQWQRMAHAMTFAAHIERLSSSTDTTEFLREAGMIDATVA